MIICKILSLSAEENNRVYFMDESQNLIWAELGVSGDKIIEKPNPEAKPGDSYEADSLKATEYADVIYFENDAPKTLSPVSRNSGDNIIIINYDRIIVKVKFDDNGATSGDVPTDLIIPSGKDNSVPGDNGLEKVGHTFGGWSDESGKIYESGDKFEALPEDEPEVVLEAGWNPNPNTVTIRAGENIEYVAFMDEDKEIRVTTKEYKYGETVNIKAVLENVPDGYSVTFDTWSGDRIDEFLGIDASEGETSFEMPDFAVELIANANIKAEKATYTIRYLFENISGDKYLEDKEQELTVSGDTGDILNEDGFKEEYVDEKNFEGFTYKKILPFGDKIIKGDSSLIIDIYYNRNEYTLEVLSGDYIDEVSGAGTYKYGQKVNINAKVKDSSKDEGYDYKFDEWDGVGINSLDKFNENSKNNTFTMPAKSLRLTAKAYRIAADIDTKEPKWENDRKFPEPGDEISYEVHIKNNKKNNNNKIEVTLDITALSGEEIIKKIYVDGEE